MNEREVNEKWDDKWSRSEAELSGAQLEVKIYVAVY